MGIDSEERSTRGGVAGSVGTAAPASTPAPAPVPNPAPAPPERAAPAWLKQLEADGLLITNPYSRQGGGVGFSPDVKESGVSLWFLNELSTVLDSTVGDRDTTAVVSKVVCSITAKPPSNKRGRLFDFIPKEHTGCPAYYVVHPWKNKFRDTIKQLLAAFQDGYSDELTETEVQWKLKNTFVWIDWIAVNQHRQTNVAADLYVKEMVKVCEKGAAVVLDPDLSVMTRTWCLYEVWCFVYYGDVNKILACLPNDLNVSSIAQFETLNERLDLGRTTSTNPKDASKIMSEVKGCVGMKSFTKTLQDALKLTMHTRLRWSKKLKEVALYSGLLLQTGEYGHLQQVLHGIPELNDDARTLAEIRDIYHVYDTENKGDLNEEQFAEVLSLSGFGPEEAKDIFVEVNTDGEGGVSLEEFEEWWMKTNRQNEAKYRKTVVMTSAALADNLTCMCAFLERMGLHDLTEFFRSFIHKLENSGAELQPAAMKGDWQSMAESIAWKLHTGDFKAACKLVYDALLWNSDQLERDPRQLAIPDKLMDPAQICTSLSEYLRLFYLLLRQFPGRRSHAELFKRYSNELKNPAVITSIVDNNGNAPKNGQLVSYAEQKFDLNKFVVVRDMINLKYGDEKPIERSLIVEAEKSLGQWMALSKRRPQDAKMVDDMATGYLASYSPQQDDAAVVKATTKLGIGSIMGNVRKKHDIPADGPYKSMLHFMGPDAQAYLEEMASKEEVHADEPPVAAAHPKTPSVGGREIITDLTPPSMDAALSKEPQGNFAKVKGAITRLWPRPPESLSFGSGSSDDESVDARSSRGALSSPAGGSVCNSPARATQSRPSAQKPGKVPVLSHLGGAVHLHQYVVAKTQGRPPPRISPTPPPEGAPPTLRFKSAYEGRSMPQQINAGSHDSLDSNSLSTGHLGGGNRLHQPHRRATDCTGPTNTPGLTTACPLDPTVGRSSETSGHHAGRSSDSPGRFSSRLSELPNPHPGRPLDTPGLAPPSDKPPDGHSQLTLLAIKPRASPDEPHPPAAPNSSSQANMAGPHRMRRRSCFIQTEGLDDVGDSVSPPKGGIRKLPKLPPINSPPNQQQLSPLMRGALVNKTKL